MIAKDGLSVILMTSEMNDLLTLSDRIIVMYSGEIVLEGPSRDILKKPIHPHSIRKKYLMVILNLIQL